MKPATDLFRRSFLSEPGTPRRGAAVLLVGLPLLLVVLAYGGFLGHGLMYTQIWLNDTFALLDAAYRVQQGQIPSVDFQSFFGPLVFGFAALGLTIGVDPASVLAFNAICVSLVLLPLLSVIVYRRLPLGLATLIVIFVALLILVPLGAGRSVGEASWGAYYNRHGWAALIILVLLYLEPVEKSALWARIETLGAALLVLFAFYLKITFGLGAMAFLVFNATGPAYNRRVALQSLAISAAVILLLELSVGATVAYLDQVWRQLDTVITYVGPWASLGGLARLMILNPWSIAGSVVLIAVFWRYGSLRDIVFVLAGVGLSVLLLHYSGGSDFGLYGLVAVAACAAEHARRAEKQHDAGPEWRLRRNGGALVCLAVVAMYIAEPTVVRVVVWFDYVRSTDVGSDRDTAVAPIGASGALSRFLVDVTEDRIHDPAETGDQEDGLPTGELPVVELTAYEYGLTIEDGASLLGDLEAREAKIFVADCANPFNILLSLPPTRNGDPFLWTAAKYTADHRPTDEQMFTDADMIMVPRHPACPDTTRFVLRHYRVFLVEEFPDVRGSRDWVIMSRG